MFWALLLLPLLSLQAEEFRIGGFHYYKELEGPSRDLLLSPSSPSYGRVELDADMIRSAGAFDVRPAYNTIPLPFFRRKIRSESTEGSVTPTVIFTKRTKDEKIYVLSLPELPEGRYYTKIKVEGGHSFETGVLVESGDSPDRLSTVGRRVLYSYRGVNLDTVRLNGNRHRYLRLTFDEARGYTFPRVYYGTEVVDAKYKVPVDKEKIRHSYDPDQKATIYYIENPGHNKIERLTLSFEEERYHRRVKIETMPSSAKKWDTLLFASLSRLSGDEETQEIDFYNPVRGELKLTIFDEDNAPLTLASVGALAPREEIIFRLPSNQMVAAYEKSDFRIYYGNAYLSPPSYDIEETYDSSLPHTTLQASQERENPDFAYSLLAPPLSSWVIRLLFLAGVLLFLFPTIRILKRYGEEVRERNTTG